MFTRLFLLVTALLTAIITPASAQTRNFIRDAEVENTIRTFATPLFQAAGLDPSAVKLHIIQDPSLNAFVAAGQNMFFHTGLLIRGENPNQLIGVIAHETGHIAGGHLARLGDAYSNAGMGALLATVLGAAVGVAAGRADVGMAVMMGGQDAAMRNLLAYSRGEESSADQAALRYLEATGQSAQGLVDFFNILGDQELLVTERQDPYVRTHPLTRDRVLSVEEHVAKSPLRQAKVSPELDMLHQRMRAKLFAYLEPINRVNLRYKANDNSVPARYARAIAAYRKPDLNTALPLIDGLIKEFPDDPYFWELKGQMLFENMRGPEALAPYRKALELRPHEPLFHLQLAQVLIEQADEKMMQEALKHLSIVVHKEPRNWSAWRLTSIAAGRSGDEGMAAYAMAEQAMIEGRYRDAAFQVGKAERLLQAKGPIWLRLQDIKERTAHLLEQEKRKGK